MVNVKVKKLKEDAIIPFYKHDGDMGLDITALYVEYDEKYDRFIYHTGLAFQLPEGYGMLIFPRSSNTKTEAYLPNSVGILDATYTGELIFAYKLRVPSSWYIIKESELSIAEKSLDEGKLKYSLENLEILNELAPYKEGDRIGQIVILPYPKINFIEVNELSETERGEDGGINRTDNNFK